jgi:hypothetical protein
MDLKCVGWEGVYRIGINQSSDGWWDSFEFTVIFGCHKSWDLIAQLMEYLLLKDTAARSALLPYLVCCY